MAVGSAGPETHEVETQSELHIGTLSLPAPAPPGSLAHLAAEAAAAPGSSKMEAYQAAIRRGEALYGDPLEADKRAAQSAADSRFDAIDANHDGVIDRAEFAEKVSLPCGWVRG